MPKTGTAPASSPMHNMIHNTESESTAAKETGEKYKVMTGIYERPDYCWIDGKAISESKMLRKGFKRITEISEQTE